MRKPGRSIHLASTRELRWQEECEALVTLTYEFEVRDLQPAHLPYCRALAERHGWSVVFRKTKARFFPPSRMRLESALATLQENGSADEPQQRDRQ